jgi:hypothetical protein
MQKCRGFLQKAQKSTTEVDLFVIIDLTKGLLKLSVYEKNFTCFFKQSY